MYNKNSVAVPYIASGTSKKTVGLQAETYLEEEETGEVNSDDNEDDLEADKMIKVTLPITTNNITEDACQQL